MRGSIRTRSQSRWSNSTDVSPRHPPNNTSTAIDDFLDRYLNRIRIEDAVVDSDIQAEPISETNDADECEDLIVPGDWRVSLFNNIFIFI